MTFTVLVVKEIFEGGFNKRMHVINFLLYCSIKRGVGCHLFEKEGYIVDS